MNPVLTLPSNPSMGRFSNWSLCFRFTYHNFISHQKCCIPNAVIIAQIRPRPLPFCFAIQSSQDKARDRDGVIRWDTEKCWHAFVSAWTDMTVGGSSVCPPCNSSRRSQFSIPRTAVSASANIEFASHEMLYEPWICKPGGSQTVAHGKRDVFLSVSRLGVGRLCSQRAGLVFPSQEFNVIFFLKYL